MFATKWLRECIHHLIAHSSDLCYMLLPHVKHVSVQIDFIILDVYDNHVYICSAYDSMVMVPRGTYG